MIIKDYIKFRNNITHELDAVIKNSKYALNLEKAVFNYTINECVNRKIIKRWDNPRFVTIYIDHLRTVMKNMIEPAIRNKINENSLTPHAMSFMTHQELKPDRWNKLITAKINRDRSKYEMNIDAATDTFTCRKCKKKKCSYYQMQTRSADEPMTTFVSCLSCGNRWKC
jgi:transcription elongation factor S-II